jgi:hypothetical protein
VAVSIKCSIVANFDNNIASYQVRSIAEAIKR